MALAFIAHARATHVLQPKASGSSPRQQSGGSDASRQIWLLSTSTILASRIAGGGPRRPRVHAKAAVTAEAVDVTLADAQRSPAELDDAVNDPEYLCSEDHGEPSTSSTSAGESFSSSLASGASTDASARASAKLDKKKKENKSFLDCLDIVTKFENNEMPKDLSCGVTTGWKSLDALYRPVRGEVTVVTGTPGSGKSEFLCSLALNLAQMHSWRFLVAPFEHKQEDWSIQMLEKLRKVRASQLRGQDLDTDLNYLAEHFTRLGDYSQDLDVDVILSSAARQAQALQDKGGLHGLIIDPFNCVERPLNCMFSDTQIVSNFMSSLQQFAKRYHTHVWVVVHPTKHSQLSGNMPSMYDCAGSAHWFNKCDNGILVRRPFAKSWAQQKQKDSDQVGSPNQVELKVDKIRNYYAGKHGIANLMFLPETRGYEEL